MSGDQSKLQRFEIIKNLYAKQTIGVDDRMEFGELSVALGTNESNITPLIRMMHPKFVKSQTIGDKRFVYLTNESFNVMDKVPQPITWDEFTSRVDHPKSDFGEVIGIKNPKTIKEKIGDFVDHFKKWIVITASIIAILAGTKSLGLW